MKCGIFGKLPSKRDFVVHNLPRQFLSFWENWLQSAVAASHSQLGSEWHEAFLSAPIWRFWMGSKICGSSVAGAIMPSVDKVGRYFPLTVCACAPDGTRIDPPVVNPMEDWYLPVEDALLRALDEGFEGEASELVEELAFPPLEATRPQQTGSQRTLSGMIVLTLFASQCEEALRVFRCDDVESFYAPRSYWWTSGGQRHPSRVVVATRMPDPFHFGAFLTGNFDGEVQ
jgi:type VI secretion system protein ImpM